MKHISLPNVETIVLELYYQKILTDLLDFIKINGSSLNILKFHKFRSDFPDHINLGGLLEVVGQYCQNLNSLTTIYEDGLRLSDDQRSLIIQVLTSTFNIPNTNYYVVVW